ncbi:peptide chain release factor 2 [Gelria sp. Kuro-4]|uniref:peptide chain release factor 2 n=1 Tax=Gelria sp. Kuro-4 TaxID=2796927 RepID=UPI001C7F1044|nr:peptide chain release factor 2 [Gelria sp. Kuro-4]
MLLYEDLKRELNVLEDSIREMGVSLDIAGKEARIRELEAEIAKPGFWDDPARAEKVMPELSALKERVERYRALAKEAEDLAVLCELGAEAEDAETAHEVAAGLAELKRNYEDLHLEALLAGPYDRLNAILSLHAGAGGTEAQDWAEMLLRMYTRWAEKSGFKVELWDVLPGEEAGIKSATFLVSGPNAYGYLKGERGVHRLVRHSPFDAAGRRHTSFASLDVIPEVNQDMAVEIRPEDLKIDTYRSGGAGGQHVNKTDSAVRITHLPTGIVVTCQNERSQHANRLTAMRILQARLFDLKRKEEEAKLNALRGEQQEIAWGSQIRSYIFEPYTLVKDHRTGEQMGNVQAVMDGELDPFIKAYLRSQVN